MTRKKNGPNRVDEGEEKEGNGVGMVKENEKKEVEVITIDDSSDEISPTKHHLPDKRRPMDLSSEPSTSMEPRAAAGPVTLAPPPPPSPPHQSSWLWSEVREKNLENDEKAKANTLEILGETVQRIVEKRRKGECRFRNFENDNDIIRKYVEVTNDKTPLDVLNIKPKRKRGTPKDRAPVMKALKRPEPNDGHGATRDSPVKKSNSSENSAPKPRQAILAPPIDMQVDQQAASSSQSITPGKVPIKKSNPPRISGGNPDESLPKPRQVVVPLSNGHPALSSSRPYGQNKPIVFRSGNNRQENSPQNPVSSPGNSAPKPHQLVIAPSFSMPTPVDPQATSSSQLTSNVDLDNPVQKPNPPPEKEISGGIRTIGRQVVVPYVQPALSSPRPFGQNKFRFGGNRQENSPQNPVSFSSPNSAPKPRQAVIPPPIDMLVDQQATSSSQSTSNVDLDEPVQNPNPPLEKKIIGGIRTIGRQVVVPYVQPALSSPRPFGQNKFRFGGNRQENSPQNPVSSPNSAPKPRQAIAPSFGMPTPVDPPATSSSQSMALGKSLKPTQLPFKQYDNGPTIRQVLDSQQNPNQPLVRRLLIAPQAGRPLSNKQPERRVVQGPFKRNGQKITFFRRQNNRQENCQDSTGVHPNVPMRKIIRFENNRQENVPGNPVSFPPTMNRPQMPQLLETATDSAEHLSEKNRDQHIALAKEMEQEVITVEDDPEVVEQSIAEPQVSLQIDRPCRLDWKPPQKSSEGMTLKRLLDAELDEPDKSPEVSPEGMSTPPVPVKQEHNPASIPGLNAPQTSYKGMTLKQAMELFEKERNEANTVSYQFSDTSEAIVERGTPTPPVPVKQVHEPAAIPGLNAPQTSYKGITLKQAKELVESGRNETNTDSQQSSSASGVVADRGTPKPLFSNLPFEQAKALAKIFERNGHTTVFHMPVESTPPVPIDPASNPGWKAPQTSYIGGVTMKRGTELIEELRNVDSHQHSKTSEADENSAPTRLIRFQVQASVKQTDQMRNEPIAYEPFKYPVITGEEDFQVPTEQAHNPASVPRPSDASSKIHRILTQPEPPIPVKVIWKKRTITVPKFMRCDHCQDRMELWCDNHGKGSKLLGPCYRCNGCTTVRSIAIKFDEDESTAEAAWPEGKMTGPTWTKKNFDEEGEEVPKPPKKTSKKTQKQKRQELQCQDPQNLEPAPQALEDPGSSVPSTSSTMNEDPVPEAVEDPKEIVNIKTKKIVLGNTSTYSLTRLLQKVMAVSGRAESEEDPLNTEVMDNITAKDFMQSLTTLLMSQNSSENNE